MMPALRRCHFFSPCALLLALSLCLAAGPAVRSCAADFAATGEEKCSLNGRWQFSVTQSPEGNPPREAQAWTETMAVPGNWDQTNKFAHYVGKGWYRRTFKLPAGWQGSRVALRFEAVYESSLVWLNGTLLGRHSGGYLPFEYDITDTLKPAGHANEVIVMADNTYRRGAWWAWGGISRDVNLIRHNDVRIIRQHITAEPDLQSGKASVTVEYRVENAGAREQEVTLTPALKSPGAADFAGLPGAGPVTLKVAAGTTATTTLRVTLEPAQVQLWHFDHPSLYELQTIASAGGKTLHARADRFGIRKVEVREGKFFLNGEPMRLCGFNRVSDDRIHGNTEPDAVVRKDVDMMKSMGANMARLMHFPQAVNLLDYLDEKGFMIIEEIPVWGGGDPNCFKDNPRTKQWLSEMVERDYNHPCIIGWSPGNELQKHFDYVASMLEHVRKNLDSHRLAVHISNTVQRKNYSPANDPASVSDMIFWNSYGGAKAGAMKVHQQWPDKTQFFSEFGMGMLGIEIDRPLPAGLIKMFEEIRRETPYVAGVSLWTFNDYRSNFPGSNSYEERSWGVVNSWRQERRAATQIREEYAPIRKLELVSAGGAPAPGGEVKSVIRITPRGAGDMPAFTLSGYVVKWEVVLASGKTAGGGLLPLPALKPGSPVWEQPITWRMPAEGAHEIAVSLITPTDYVVTQTRVPLAAPPAPAIRQIIPSNGWVRILLDKPRGAEEVKVRYGVNGKLDKGTPATIGDAAWVSGLDATKEYQFAAVALNSLGESKPSAVVTAQPKGPGLPPRILDVTALDGGFNVGYSSAADDTGYTIELGTASGEYHKIMGDLKVKGSCRIKGLKNGRTYFFRMKRAAKNGESGWSEECRVTPQAPAAPAAPVLHGVVRGPGMASLRFEPAPGATSYVVRYKADGGKEIRKEIEAAFVEQCLISGLENGKGYSFAIAACNENGMSDYSEAVAVK